MHTMSANFQSIDHSVEITAQMQMVLIPALSYALNEEPQFGFSFWLDDG